MAWFIQFTLVSPVLAQTTFEKCMGWIDDDLVTGAIRLQEGGFAVCATTMDTVSTYTNGLILFLDSLGNIGWTGRYGSPYPNEKPADLTETFDRHLVSVGDKGGATTLQKWTPSGTLLWQQTYWGLQSATSVISTTDSCLVFLGSANSSITVFKADSSGQVLWTKSPATAGYVYGFDIIQNHTGGYVICGQKDLDPHPGTAAYLLGLKPDGSVWWQQWHGSTEHVQKARKIMQMPDNGYVYCGFHSGSYLVPPGGPVGDGIIVRVSGTGTVAWEKIYGGPEKDEFYAFDTVPGGGFICCGFTENYGAGQKDVWLVRTDPAGDTLWTRTYGGPYDDVGVTVHTLPGGGFFICGYTNSFGNNGYDLYFIRTDENGYVEQRISDQKGPR